MHSILFTQNHMLSYHRRCHTGEPAVSCYLERNNLMAKYNDFLFSSFASKEYLKHHNRIHSGFRPYKCETCGRAFAQRNSLHQHMKIHTGERPYHCKDCDKQFTQLNALQRHQRIHTGEKPYMCSMCGRTFTDKSTVRRHTLVKNLPLFTARFNKWLYSDCKKYSRPWASCKFIALQH
uniref:GDNF-inducible zinc finger protein 1-like n=1 Tax=Sinocyclocheilus rhinocerous TaxID=307959 RepID=A0A673JAQ1_9TELE